MKWISRKGSTYIAMSNALAKAKLPNGPHFVRMLCNWILQLLIQILPKGPSIYLGRFFPPTQLPADACAKEDYKNCVKFVCANIKEVNKVSKKIKDEKLLGVNAQS